MKSPYNYIFIFLLYLISVAVDISNGSQVSLELLHLRETALALLLAWIVEKDKPLLVELTVKKEGQ